MISVSYHKLVTQFVTLADYQRTESSHSKEDSCSVIPKIVATPEIQDCKLLIVRPADVTDGFNSLETDTTPERDLFEVHKIFCNHIHTAISQTKIVAEK